MNVQLQERTVDHVKRFYEESKDERLRELFPFMDKTLEENIEMFHESTLPGASSYGRSITVDDKYVGDAWCYCIDEEKEKSCFYSIVLFDKTIWGQGVGTKATDMFLEEVKQKYSLEKICAFTYKANIGSIKTLEKTGFAIIEEFEEEGVASYYLEKVL